ncbi:FAD/NAD(P)-binding domain-containing protein [Trichoderma citrinoviride]|uniref:FAD/NAD(P)-binding domain-containing protein n=1 Tax=Trichoderma citrinoviride TaxID=58853 RepID=A0A2T4BBE3_9HYPO|nr:FAD/NAD(P)-binding domain-containing protein [Trichoderma citrinoviride]PTB66637.1 FAD/NAD(P)-binding domain-containing protein [Trichoderma citrinoviride]
MSPSSPAAYFHVKKIAIIGAGPSGLSAAKYLRAQKAFDSIVIYEQQRDIGGIWNCSKHLLGVAPIPEHNDLGSPKHCVSDDPSIISSPLYHQLYANIPLPLMRFSDQLFPAGTALFPSIDVVREYLLKYAEEVMDLIQFGVQVGKVTPLAEGKETTWMLEAKSIDDNRMIRDNYDAVVVATGHYSQPMIPELKNLAEFMETYPSIVSHSRDYRSPTSFKDKKVIVVGNGPSGTDIAFQINRISTGKTMLSVRTPTPPPRLAYVGCEEVSEIEEFLVDERGIRFKDGRIEKNIDAVIFCTGYRYDYPFLHDLRTKLITTGQGVHGLYKHIFCIDHPTLAFSALNMKTAPWPLSEAQAAVFAAVWSNSIQLPGTEEMHRWAKALYAEQGERLHLFRTITADGLYINDLYEWVKKSAHKGKEPPFWTDITYWHKATFPQVRLKYDLTGCKATGLEELGFSYEPDWREK